MEQSTSTADADGDLFPVLTHKHCRSVLHYFTTHAADLATVHDLGQFVHDHPGRTADADHVETHLHHSTLPTLAAAGLVEYDGRTHSVRYRGHPAVEAWMPFVGDSLGAAQ